MTGIIIIIALCFALFLFMMIHEPARAQTLENPLYLVVLVFFTVFLPIVCFIFAVPRFLTLLEIDESGIKTSVFHILKRKKVLWNEVWEVRYYFRVLPFIFVAVNGSLYGLTYEEIVKRKDVIQITLTKKVLEAFKAYCPLDIINLPDFETK